MVRKIGLSSYTDFGADGIPELVAQSHDGTVGVWNISGFALQARHDVGAASVTAQLEVVADVTGNGKADFIWRQRDGGLQLWDMDGTQIVSARSVGTLPLSWSIRQSADFTGDGKADLLAQSEAGALALLEFTEVGATATPLRNLTDDWQIVGAGNADAEGRADLLVRRSDGALALAHLTAQDITVDQPLGTISTSSSIEGFDDFNGDGTADVLWRDSSGTLALWSLDGGAVASRATVREALPFAWRVARVADFTGDGKADIVLSNSGGDVALWQMDGAAIRLGMIVGSVGPDWLLPRASVRSTTDAVFSVNSAGVVAQWSSDESGEIRRAEFVRGTPQFSVDALGDFDGDGDTDLLRRYSNGTLVVERLNGSTHVGQVVLRENLAAEWTVAGSGDFTRDGIADILLRGAGGAAAVWALDESGLAWGHRITPLPEDARIAGVADFGGDGNADVLWRDREGTLHLWQMDGWNVVEDGIIRAGLTEDWQVAGVADFNDDGRADMLLRTADGTVALWDMNGATVERGAVLMEAKASRVASITDLDGDGRPSIVLERPDGTLIGIDVAFGAVVGTTILNHQLRDFGQVVVSHTAFSEAPARILDIAHDWNGDNVLDTLYQDSLGRVRLVVVGSDGGALSESELGFMDRSSTAWVGDVNGDARLEIVWQRPPELGLRYDAALWEIRDQRLAHASPVWNDGASVVGAGDFDRDGTLDLLWRNPENQLWIIHSKIDPHPEHALNPRLIPTHSEFVGVLAADAEVRRVADLTGDGKLDLLVAGSGGTEVWMLDDTSFVGKWHVDAPQSDSTSAVHYTVEQGSWLRGDFSFATPSTGLAYELLGTPEHGSVTVDVASGAFVYVPDANEIGSDAFSIRAIDGIQTNTTSVTVNVVPPSTHPAELPVTRQVTTVVTVGEGEILGATNTRESTAVFTMNVNGAFATSSADVLARALAIPGDAPDYMKAWQYVIDQSYHWGGFSNWYWPHNLPLFFNSFGYGVCGNHAEVLAGLWQLMGYDVRIWQLSGHAVPEFWADGHWHMLDADEQGYFTDDDGRILGVQELHDNPDYLFHLRTPLSTDYSDDYPHADYAWPVPYLGELQFFYSEVTSLVPLDGFYDFHFSLPAGASLGIGLPANFTVAGDTFAPASEAQAAFIKVVPGTTGMVYAPLALYDIYGAGEVKISGHTYTVGSAELTALLADRMSPDAFLNPVEVLAAGEPGLTFAYVINRTLDFSGELHVTTSGDSIDLSALVELAFGNFRRDFTGDLRDDWVVQDGDGALHVFGSGSQGLRDEGTLGSASMRASAIADFDGDGRPDVLMIDSNGEMHAWLYKGMERPVVNEGIGHNRVLNSAEVFVGTLQPTDMIAGSADYDHDGNVDLFVQTGNGSVDVWRLHGGTLEAISRVVDGVADSDAAGWAVRYVADYNGDGRADLLMQRAADADAREIAVRYGSDTAFEAPHAIATLSLGELIGARDVDGDGTNDLVFEDAASTLRVFLTAQAETLQIAATLPIDGHVLV